MTGALDPLLNVTRKADMDVVALVGYETCLNYKGTFCSICWQVCPIRDEAISIVTVQSDVGVLQIPTVDSDKCTGCGTCNKHCVLSEAAMDVLPRDLDLGRVGRKSIGRDKF